MSILDDSDFYIKFYESVLLRLPHDYATVEILGNLYTEVGRIEDGLAMDRLAIELQPENALAHYNLACSHALLNQLPKALTSLQKAVELGYKDLKWLLDDKDLVPLHPLPEFQRIVEELRGKQ